MKFKVGDKVRKIKGYKFEGIIIGGGTKLNGDRILYMVEIPEEEEVEIFYGDGQSRRGNHQQNCGGMVHIFAEQDIELVN